MMMHGESPCAEEVPPERHDRILHARLEVGDVVLMVSDSPPEQYGRPQGVSVSIQNDDSARAERIFRALAEGGEVRMPFGKTFSASVGFGMLVDRTGTPWMVNSDQDG